MWKGAYPDAEGILARHPLSKSNFDQINYGKFSDLMPDGVKQTKCITRRARRARLDCVISSEADRANLPLLDIVSAYRSAHLPLHVEMNNPLYNEFRRPKWTIGLPRTPEIEAAVHRRIVEFGPGYVPEDGEETFEETIQIVVDGLNHILILARDFNLQRFLIMSHGLRIRQIQAWITAKGDPALFAALFRNMWEVWGYGNGAFSHIWHGNRFRSDERCWNMEGGDVSHIPLPLQS